MSSCSSYSSSFHFNKKVGRRALSSQFLKPFLLLNMVKSFNDNANDDDEDNDNDNNDNDDNHNNDNNTITDGGSTAPLYC